MSSRNLPGNCWSQGVSLEEACSQPPMKVINTDQTSTESTAGPPGYAGKISGNERWVFISGGGSKKGLGLAMAAASKYVDTPVATPHENNKSKNSRNIEQTEYSAATPISVTGTQ